MMMMMMTKFWIQNEFALAEVCVYRVLLIIALPIIHHYLCTTL